MNLAYQILAAFAIATGYDPGIDPVANVTYADAFCDAALALDVVGDDEAFRMRNDPAAFRWWYSTGGPAWYVETHCYPPSVDRLRFTPMFGRADAAIDMIDDDIERLIALERLQPWRTHFVARELERLGEQRALWRSVTELRYYAPEGDRLALRRRLATLRQLLGRDDYEVGRVPFPLQATRGGR